MKAKRSLGQNFLINPGIVRKIADFGAVTEADTVVEIGPGRGILTAELAARGARIIAVEKDDDLAAELAEKYRSNSRITIIHGDVIDQPLMELIPPQAKVVANLPYNISTQVVSRMIELPSRIKTMVFMVQKEVGERICAPVGSHEYSSMSVLVGLNWDTTIGFIVGPDNFRPRPRVDSCVIRIVPRTPPFEASASFKWIVHQTFGQRRKMLRNSLSALPDVNSEKLSDLAAAAGIALDARPQNLSAQDFLRLSWAFDKVSPKTL